MLGNFSFEKQEYIDSVDMWSAILDDLGIKKDCKIRVHPDSSHRAMWLHHGFEVNKDPECVWSDGEIGGYCCEVDWNGIEIGNLVNPMGTMTDVGFGWERLLMVLEGKTRVDETSLFNQELDPITRDHLRTVDSLWDNKIKPGGKGRNYICRKLIRRMLDITVKVKWQEWLEYERVSVGKSLSNARKLWPKHKDKPPEWWWDTCGLSPEDLKKL